MGSLLVSTQGGLAHWQGLMVAVSLLTFWSLPTTDQLSIVSTSSLIGEDAYLRISSKPPDAVAFVWYKGRGVDPNNIIAFFIPMSSCHLSGLQNELQQIITEDGSLLLKEVTMMDAGMYTVVAHFPGSKMEIGFGQLDVYEPLKAPILLASSYFPKENEEDVVLTCYSNGPVVQWLFNDRYMEFTERTKPTADGRRITISPVKREDSGDYKCKASNSIMGVESQPVNLHVLY